MSANLFIFLSYCILLIDNSLNITEPKNILSIRADNPLSKTHGEEKSSCLSHRGGIEAETK